MSFLHQICFCVFQRLMLIAFYLVKYKNIKLHLKKFSLIDCKVTAFFDVPLQFEEYLQEIEYTQSDKPNA